MPKKALKYELPLGRYGENLNTNVDDLLPGYLESSSNITLYENSIQKDFGESAINGTALGASVRQGVDYFPTPNSQRQVVYVDTDIKKTSGVGNGSYSDLFTSLTADKIGQFIQCGQELSNRNRRLLFVNGFDFPQMLDGDGSATERIGFVSSITNGLDATMGDATLVVNLTAHGLATGNTVSLVGFSDVGGVSPNASGALVTKINDDSFSVEMDSAAGSTESSGGGTGKVYAHPVDWASNTQPIGGCLHNNRVILFLKHLLFISNDEDHTDFEVSDTYVFPVRTDIGNEIRGTASFLDRLVVFKHPYGIVHMRDPAASNVLDIDQKLITAESGLAGKNAFTQAGPYLWYLTPDATIERIVPTDSLDDLRHEQVSAFFNLNDKIRNLVDASKLDKAEMEFDSVHKEIICAVTKSGSQENNLLIKINVKDPNQPKFTISEKTVYTSIWKQRDSNNKERLVAGSGSGFLINMTDTARSLSSGVTSFPVVFPVIFSEEYESSFKTVQTDFSDQYPDFADYNKQLVSIEPVIDPDQGDIDWLFRIYADGRMVDSIQFQKTTSTPTFAITFPITFSEDDIQNEMKDIIGAYGKRFAFEGINLNSNQNSKITKLICRFIPGDERNL